ncbi:MAG: hypothetical protein Q7T81_01470 [Pseudolabrys sp.]|nr:hypothetical protein [Pseudolabrys sp.]
MKSIVIAAAALTAVLFIASPTNAAPMAPIAAVTDSATIQVSGGCGPNAWRGPWGHCRNTPYYGQMPDGGWKPLPREWSGCAPGWWRGPWGHCRHTPYHGNLPGGGWQ